MTTKKRLGRLAAGASAFALVGVGLLGTAASAEPIPGDINPETPGSLTIHKYDGDTQQDRRDDGTQRDDTSGLGSPLDGVEFTLYPINLEKGLDTSEGWEQLEALNAGDIDRDLFGTPSTATTDDGVATFDTLEVGAYYVEETGSGANLITGPVAPFIVSIPYPNEEGWLYNVHVYPKNDVTTSEPTKTAGDLDGVAQTGDKVDWTITVPVPKVTNGYDEFEIQDNPGTGLEFDSWGEIAIDSAALTAGDDYKVAANSIELTGAGLTKLNEALDGSETGKVSLTAVLTTKVTTTGELTNSAGVTINGVPLVDPSGDTNWGKIIVTKVSSDDESNLEGAKFELYDGKGEDGELIGETRATNDSGELTFTVWVGNGDVTTRDGLWLKETVAPAGHVLPSDPWFAVGTVTADSTASVELTIENHKPQGPQLPLTGAQGTLLFTVVGLGLIGAGVAAVAVRRSRANN